MSDDKGWGNKWPSSPVFPQWLKDEAKREKKEYTDMYGTEINPVALGVKPEVSQTGASTFIYATNEKPWPVMGHVVCNIDKDGNIDLTPLRDKLLKQGSNLVDDQAYLYFQCEGCGEILDPHTKSFAKLQEARVNAGWACKWNVDGMGYKVYCAECGEKVK